MTPEEQGARNIELLGRQLLHFLDHPEDLAKVAGKEVVLLPNDDPELDAANAELVDRLSAQDAADAGPPVSSHLVSA